MATRKLKVQKKPTAKANVEVTTEKKTKPVLSTHELSGSYAGASPVTRSGRNLSPIVTDRVPAGFTERDRSFLMDMHKAYGTKTFERRNLDAGALSRAVGAGYVKHVSGKLDERECVFQITSKALAERLQKA